jgi:GNAT superfamily N-acetyltransferase
MVHPLRTIPPFAAPVRVERVASAELADRLAKTARARPTLPEHFAPDSPLRQYVALVDDEMVGWVTSIVTGKATWCCNLFVLPEFRRRGIARAMLCRLLANDRSGGAQQAVLLASHTGAKLYPVVGYEQIGELLLFTPQKR